MQWQKRWQQLQGTALPAVASAKTPSQLESLRVRLLGRKGTLTGLLKSLKDLPLEERRSLGPLVHSLKESLESSIQSKSSELARSSLEKEIEKTSLDSTLPGFPHPVGTLHPLTRTLDEMASILRGLGFVYASGPMLETDYHNFQALNIPQDHPARDMQDTFYVARHPEILLRTHTSPVQIRAMQAAKPPLRVFAAGRVFRHEAVDASHSAVFHQVEGLYVDKKVSMADLKGTLKSFIKALFGPKVEMRFRPSYFPFTEPSAEVDVQCLLCKGAGCAVCKRSGWLEMLGAGLVQPNVFRSVGYDPKIWSGFAFGIGVERITMLRYGIDDIRLFYQNDLRFLRQFS